MSNVKMENNYTLVMYFCLTQTRVTYVQPANDASNQPLMYEVTRLLK